MDDDWIDLTDKSSEQINSVVAALGGVIALYQKKLGESLEYRHAAVETEFVREREFLAGLKGEYERLTRHVTDGAAKTLEATS